MPGLVMSNIPTESSRRSTTNYTGTTNLQHQFTSNSTRESVPATPMTISASIPPVSSTNGSLHGGASSALMSAANGRVLPVERLRLRDWLIRMIETKAIPGLYWLDKERQVVKIPWKHAARHGWSRDKDACLFRAWAVHTKKYDPKSDTPKANPKVWKANFRCAINSLPDIEEMRDKGKSKGNDAYKVYRLHPKRSKRHSRDGQKITKRQRSTSRSRLNKNDRRQQQKKRDLVINASENLSRVSGYSITPKSNNASIMSQEEQFRKRMTEFSAEFPGTESAKRDRMSLNVRCVIKPNAPTSTSAATLYPSSTLSSPSSMKSPTPSFSVMSPSNGHHFLSSNALTTLPQPSVGVSPCSTATSTPASTPQSPPPPYEVALNHRHLTGWSMEARLEFNHSAQAAYDTYAEEYSDSDCSNMTEAEVAQMVLDIKEQSPGNSPRCLSPLDGNNNLESTLVPDYWPHKHPDEKFFFGSNFDMAPNRGPPTCNMSKAVFYPTDMSTVGMVPPIKLEPDTYPQVMPHHNPGHRYGYSLAALAGAAQSEDVCSGQSSYLLHQL